MSEIDELRLDRLLERPATLDLDAALIISDESIAYRATKAISLGLAPFLVGDAIKASLAAL